MILIVYAQYLFLQPVIALRTGTAFIRMMSLLLTVASLFPEAVELRLRKISGSLAKDIVTTA